MKRAGVLWICSIVLGSALVCGCARPPAPAPPPMVVTVQHCARPQPPALPTIRSELPFDHPATVEAMLTRDVRLRRYVDGLRAALDCYDAQVSQGGARE